MSESAAIYNEGNAEKNITAEANEAKISQLAHEINTIKKTTQRLMMEAAIKKSGLFLRKNLTKYS